MEREDLGAAKKRRGCMERGDLGLESAPPPIIPCPCSPSSLQVNWGCATPGENWRLAPGSGGSFLLGWESWKNEVDTHTFLYNSYCLFPSLGTDSWRLWMEAFSAHRSGAGCRQPRVKRKESIELKPAPVFRSPQATCCWFDQ